MYCFASGHSPCGPHTHQSQWLTLEVLMYFSQIGPPGPRLSRIFQGVLSHLPIGGILLTHYVPLKPCDCRIEYCVANCVQYGIILSIFLEFTSLPSPITPDHYTYSALNQLPVIIMPMDSNTIIALISLLITCVPGLWFVIRTLGEKRSQMQRQIDVGPDLPLYAHVCKDLGLRPQPLGIEALLNHFNVRFPTRCCCANTSLQRPCI